MFFPLVFLFSVPFVVVGSLSGAQIVPGVPLSGLAFVCPALAAAVLVHREGGMDGVQALAGRAFDAGRVSRKAWFVPALLLYPAVVALSYVLLRLSGTPLPDAHFSVASALSLAAALFVGALCEELGWSGYATQPLQARWGPVWAALTIGSAWAVWHWLSAAPGGPPGVLDRLVVARHRRGARDHGVAVRPHGRQRPGHGAVPHDTQPGLAAVPGRRITFPRGAGGGADGDRGGDHRRAGLQ
ncbi:CPBP family intramembrane glutamic endopeptidase [Nonomuraea ferruginea]